MSDPAALEARGVERVFHDGERELRILRGADLSVARGESVAILGRSGTGKSTLLGLLGLLDRPDAGTIRVEGTETATLPERRRTRLRGRRIGFVFQQYHLLPEFGALENVALGYALAYGGGLGGEAARRAGALLEALGLEERRNHRPATLSGGEQQRVAVARALVHEPAVLLCDEPTGSLDPATGARVIEAFWPVVRERGAAMVLVTHDEMIAARADRVLRLEDGILRPAPEAAAAARGGEGG